MIRRNFVILLLFVAHFAFGQNEDSLRQLIQIARPTLSSTQAVTALAIAFLDSNRLDSSEKYFNISLERESILEIDEELKYRTLSQYGYLQAVNRRFEEADSIYRYLQYNLPMSDSQQIRLMFARINVLYLLTAWDSMGKALEWGHDVIFRSGSSIDKLRYHNSKSFYFQGKKDLYKRLEQLHKAKEYLTTDMNGYKYMLNHNLSNIYISIEALDEAYLLYRENLEMAKVEKNQMQMMYALFGIAAYHQENSHYDELAEVFQKALRLQDSTGYSENISYLYLLMGASFCEREEYDSAHSYLQKGLVFAEQQNQMEMIGNLNQSIGRIFILDGDTSASGTFLERGNKDGVEFRPSSRLNLAHYYAYQGDYKKAAELMEQTWSKIDEEEEHNAIYQITANLLSSQFEEEQKLKQTLDRQRSQTQKLNFGMLVIFLIMPIAIYIIFLQTQHRNRLEELNRKLKQKNEELQQFTYICSHDLKEPIRNVSTFTGLIEYKLASEGIVESVDEYFHHIHSGINSLSTVISSLKAFSEIEGKKEGAFEEDLLKLGDVFEQACKNLAVYIEEHRAKVYLKAGSNPDETFMGSGYGLVLVLQNLIHNGIKYNDSEVPEIEVSLIWENERPNIQVKDNGIGIKQGAVETIFEPFETSNGGNENSSSGLGLAISRKIVNEFGGQIQVKSVLGKGSCFRILI